MLSPLPNMPADQRQLLKLYAQLEEADRRSLLSYAEFLLQRAGEDEPTTTEPAGPPPEPLAIPRPESESVVGAMKRLSQTYFMVDRGLILTEASSLMTAHIVHGRPAVEVIDELEGLFERHYTDLLSSTR